MEDRLRARLVVAEQYVLAYTVGMAIFFVYKVVHRFRDRRRQSTISPSAP
jgi:hypothetical protein